MDHLSAFVERYIAPDGGGLFEDEPGNLAPPLSPKYPVRSTNENASYALAQGLLELDPEARSVEGFLAFKRHMELTEIEPGLHGRWPGHELRFENAEGDLVPLDIGQSHDNVVSLAILSHHYNSGHAWAILEYGRKHWFQYNPRDPGRWSWTEMLQPGDWAILELAAGEEPDPISLLWLGLGLRLSKNWGLADLRIKFLRKVKLPWWGKAWIDGCIKVHETNRGPRENWVKGYYRDPKNPFRMAVCGG